MDQSIIEVPACFGAAGTSSPTFFFLVQIRQHTQVFERRRGLSRGFAADRQARFADGQIAGKLVVDPTADNSKGNNVNEEFGIVTAGLGAANAAAIDAANEIGSLKPTQEFDSINGSHTIGANGSMNVISVGDVQLDGSSTLTLKGCASDYFFINVSGKFAMTGTSSIQLDGVDPSHVIFNIEGSGQQVAFTGKSEAVGTFLAINRDVAVSGATVNGQIIAGMCQDIAITSGAKVDVCSPPFCPPCDCAV
jgi:choice-of-anchor A domain-containing protein